MQGLDSWVLDIYLTRLLNKGMDPMSQTFAALADPTRRAILARLAQGEVHVGELARPFHISAPAISRHLRVLERARLIERKTSAQWRVCRINGAGLRAAHDWLAPYRAYWEQSLDRLAELLDPPELSVAPRNKRKKP
jgi:DNA-binding transcriptional ArsR family regulator